LILRRNIFLLGKIKGLGLSTKETKLKIIKAAEKAVEQLIKVAEEKIITGDPEDELAADRLKNAAATKKLAIFDAFEILKRIDEERDAINSVNNESKVNTNQGFAERRSR